MAVALLASATAGWAAEAPRTARIEAGRLSLSIPARWKIVEGSEERQLRAEVARGFEEMTARYRAETGLTTPSDGIQAFRAVRLPAPGGWLIVHEVRIPEVADYYAQMRADTEQKLEWGKRQGIIEAVLENGVVEIGASRFLRIAMRQRGGSRTVTMAYWSERDPSRVSQIMVLQSAADPALERALDRCLESVTVVTPAR